MSVFLPWLRAADSLYWKMIRLTGCLIALLFVSLPQAESRDFSVLVYNVENLFDVDGVAEYRDYGPDAFGGSGYSSRRLLTKIQNIAKVMARFENGPGPDVVLFQEFELDRTPYSTWNWKSPRTFIDEWSETTVESMLTSGFDHSVSGIPVEALLYKYLYEIGISGYNVAQPDPRISESYPAQKNVIFSRFPIRWVRQRPLQSARDLLVVGLDVDGNELIVFNNHWKSGASRLDTEATRIQNAMVVRAELEAVILENPSADVIVAGDLNCYYNQIDVFPELEQSAVNSILESRIDEPNWVKDEDHSLYNLWGELPPGQRGSETYRGYWGTLMQMLLSRGLYDYSGVQYVDNSFFRVILPGENTSLSTGEPRAWVNFASGTGFSDHLPIAAWFRTVDEADVSKRIELKKAGWKEAEPSYRPSVDYAKVDLRHATQAALLEKLDETQLLDRVGDLFRVEGRVRGDGLDAIDLGWRTYEIYAPTDEVRALLKDLRDGDRVRFYGELDVYRGQMQFVIQDPEWVR